MTTYQINVHLDALQEQLTTSMGKYSWSEEEREIHREWMEGVIEEYKKEPAKDSEKHKICSRCFTKNPSKECPEEKCKHTSEDSCWENDCPDEDCCPPDEKPEVERESGLKPSEQFATRVGYYAMTGYDRIGSIYQSLLDYLDEQANSKL